MATIHVIWDPTDRLQSGPPKGAEHAAPEMGVRFP